MEGSIGRPETKYGRGGKEEMDGVRRAQATLPVRMKKKPAFMVSSLCKLPFQFGKWCRSPSRTNSTFFYSRESWQEEEEAWRGGKYRREHFLHLLAEQELFLCRLGRSWLASFVPIGILSSQLLPEKKKKPWWLSPRKCRFKTPPLPFSLSPPGFTAGKGRIIKGRGSKKRPRKNGDLSYFWLGKKGWGRRNCLLWVQ